MLNKVVNLGGLFAAKSEHPLADARELRRVVADLPRDNAFKALDEITGWFESLAAVEDFPADRLYDVVQALDDAAQPHLTRLTREYLHTARLSRSEEKRLWSINFGFWTLLSASYERCLFGLPGKPRSGDMAPATLSTLAVRALGALANIVKWEQFRYGPMANGIWLRMGGILLAADDAGVGGKPVALPGRSGISSPDQEYEKAMIFQAASLGSLLPVEIEIAERLIAHFLAGFVFTERAQIDSVYWSDLALAQAPMRLARMPAQATRTQRFLKPGAAFESMQAILDQIERGGDMPPEIDLGAQYNPRVLIRVLRHLTAYLAPIPPQRKHDRHRVKHRMAVMNGLVNAYVAFSGEFGGRPPGLPVESWVVDNVSRGGFGASLSNISGEWVKVGALIAMQPEGGDNWLLGVVRRYQRDSESEARVGIQTIATRATAAELRVRTSSSYAAVAGIPALLLGDGNEPGEMRVVLPAGTFSPRESMEYGSAGQRQVLMPVAIAEQADDYEVARYRLS